MADPVLHLLAGPNGAGKSTFCGRVLGPATHLPFNNADVIAAQTWPGEEPEHAYDAAEIAARRRQELLDRRQELLDRRQSFITETVFSHPSKVELVTTATGLGYLVTLHVILVPVQLAVARVANRVDNGGHLVPEDKVRDRYERLWGHIASAIPAADETYCYDNSKADRPYRTIATLQRGRLLGTPDWPGWAALALTALGTTQGPPRP